MHLYNFVVQICCFQCLFHLNQNILARNNIFSWMDIEQTLWPFILLENSETLNDWCNAQGSITENQICYHRKSNKNWNPPIQRKVKCRFRLITEEKSFWKFDRLWTKRWKEVVLFSRNSFQMRKNKKAWWKAILLLREIEFEKLSVLTRRAWCADDCVRGSDESLSWFCWIAMSTLPNNVTTTHWKEKNRASICILVLSFSSATKTGNVIQDTATYRAVCSQRTLERCIIITLCCLKVPRLRKFSLASSFFQKTMQSLFFYWAISTLTL